MARRLNKAGLKKHLPLAPAARTMLNSLIASIGEGLIVVDEYAQISQINQPALDILGFSKKEMEGIWLPSILNSFDTDGAKIPESERLTLQALLTGLPISRTLNYMRRDGSLVPVYATASPFLVRGRPRGAVIVFRDVTRERQIERAKDEFVSIASHQLRTPLTSIRLFAELLEDSGSGKLLPKQKNYVNKILLSTEKMINLVTELLNISRLNLGQLDIQKRPTNINDLAAACLDEVDQLARSHRIKLEFSSQIKPSQLVSLDRNLVSQAVHNLLSNAIHYSPPKSGRVKLSLSKTNGYYRIAVSDNGIGVPQAAKRRIYERFFRADNAIKTQSEGTGLGLYLVKTVAEASGGKTGFSGREGAGSTFYICLPADTAVKL